MGFNSGFKGLNQRGYKSAEATVTRIRLLGASTVRKYDQRGPLLWFCTRSIQYSRSQLPRGLRRRSAAARLLRSWVRIPPGAWMFVCCQCYVLSGRCLCDELITRPEESYRLCCVVVCDLETSRMRRPWPALGRSTTAKKKKVYNTIILQSNPVITTSFYTTPRLWRQKL